MRDIHQAVRAQRLVIANIELALLESRRSKSRRDGQTLCDSRPHRETSSWSATTMSELKSGTTGWPVCRRPRRWRPTSDSLEAVWLP
jgi:hypothetical protein